MAHLSTHDLKQLDDAYLAGQPEPVVRSLLSRALDDLRAARDRLNQTPHNSSRPSGSMPPWHSNTEAGAGDAEQAAPVREAPGAEALPAAQVTEPAAAEQPDAPPHASEAEAAPAAPLTPAVKKPGRAVGATGHGRTQKLAHSGIEEHRPSHCTACGAALSALAAAQAWTGWDQIEMLPLSGAFGANTGAGTAAQPGELGLRLQVTRHLLMRQRCACGHESQALALRSEADELWAGVDIGEQRLLGPRLAAAIVSLCVRMRLSRRKVSELMLEWFGLELSPALIDQTVHQGARAVAALEAELAAELERAALVHADETGWREAGQALWWWVLCCAHTVLYMVGRRSKDMLTNALSLDFAGWLMTDGYGAYRDRQRRLRCWAHLMRKLRGLVASSDARAATAGVAMLALFEGLMAAIYAARDPCGSEAVPGPHPPPAVTHVPQVEQLHALCQQHREAAHPALRALARELLNDWEAIMCVLSHPHLPLTNNLAERQLRHHVIARRLSYGTRTPVGSHSAALLASVIDTCRARGAHATEFLARAIHAARMGLSTPELPPIPPHLRDAGYAAVG